MEWWKLFSGTFVLIFLAELGDKTQLAAMAKTADSPDGSMAKWVVFLGASLALAASTFIAVFLGHFLKALVPDERYIKIAAGAVFLVFGCMILYEALAGPKPEPAVAAPAGTMLTEPGLVGGLALRAAQDFESLAADRYRRLAEKAPRELADLLRTLSAEEQAHLHRLRCLPEQDCGDGTWHPAPPRRDAGVSGRTIRTDDVVGPDLLAELIEHEEATAAFYRDLAGRTLIPSVSAVLAALAQEESAHAQRLRAHGAV